MVAGVITGRGSDAVEALEDEREDEWGDEWGGRLCVGEILRNVVKRVVNFVNGWRNLPASAGDAAGAD